VRQSEKNDDIHVHATRKRKILTIVIRVSRFSRSRTQWKYYQR